MRHAFVAEQLAMASLSEQRRGGCYWLILSAHKRWVVARCWRPLPLGTACAKLWSIPPKFGCRIRLSNPGTSTEW
ncbi:hypothetical protein ACS0TY_002225 [Phlomoides rotata]